VQAIDAAIASLTDSADEEVPGPVRMRASSHPVERIAVQLVEELSLSRWFSRSVGNA
jgi:hypothetical protein